ncbi:MAG: hypothetical protein ACE5KM_24035, partial [Planctomycetaceae bacterium]
MANSKSVSITVGDETFNAKQTELRDELALVDERITDSNCNQPTDVAAALTVFDFSQNLVGIRRGSN